MTSRFVIASLLATVAAGSPARALDAPKAVAEDSNMRVVAYNPRQRVLIIGTIGRATNITLSSKERIIRVVFGAEGLWEGPDPADVKQGLKNNLPLWPRKTGQTNLVITTEDTAGEEHAYQYTLIARPARTEAEGDDPDATYGLIQTYPDRERAERAAKARATSAEHAATRQARRAKGQLAAARVRLEQEAASRPCNWRYTAQGDVSLAPVSVCDDGQQTMLRYQGNMRVPGVFVLGADGSEQAIPFAMRGDTMVIPSVAQELHLRLGKAVLYVFNLAFDPIGLDPETGRQADPETGTPSPNVFRTLRRASAQ